MPRTKKADSQVLDRLYVRLEVSRHLSEERLDEMLAALDEPGTRSRLAKVVQEVLDSRKALGGAVAVLE